MFCTCWRNVVRIYWHKFNPYVQMKFRLCLWAELMPKFSSKDSGESSISSSDPFRSVAGFFVKVYPPPSFPFPTPLPPHSYLCHCFVILMTSTLLEPRAKAFYFRIFVWGTKVFPYILLTVRESLLRLFSADFILKIHFVLQASWVLSFQGSSPRFLCQLF